jgi:pimeloyl-ACP methyl ester carboxylesterase
MDIVSRSRVGLAVVLGVAAAIGGCDGGSGRGVAAGSPTGITPSSAAPVRAGAACTSLASTGTAVSFRSGDVSLAGLTFGRSATGIVLVSKSTGDVCGWLTYATELVRFGYLVLAFDPAGSGASTGRHPAGTPIETDVLAAVDYLRAHGATTVVLFGAEDGAAAAILAVPKLSPPAAALVGLSPPATSHGVDVAAAAWQTRTRALYVTADPDEVFAPRSPDGLSIDQIAASGVSAEAFRCTTRNHGTDLLLSACAVSMQTAIHDFLTNYAPAG